MISIGQENMSLTIVEYRAKLLPLGYIQAPVALAADRSKAMVLLLLFY